MKQNNAQLTPEWSEIYDATPQTGTGEGYRGTITLTGGIAAVCTVSNTDPAEGSAGIPVDSLAKEIYVPVGNKLYGRSIGATAGAVFSASEKISSIINFKDDMGAIYIPIEAGTNNYVISGIDPDMRTHRWSLEFVDAALPTANLVTPTGGEYTFRVSSKEDPLNYEPVANGELRMATQVYSGQASPASLGTIVNARMTLSDIAVPNGTFVKAQWESQR